MAVSAAGQIANPLTGQNNSWTGTNTFERVNIGTTNYGWRYNTNAGGQMEIVFPGGTAAFYETGNPPAPYMYFAGTIQADYLIGAISGITINADGLSGTIPHAVMSGSATATVSAWLEGTGNAGAAGVVYTNTGPASQTEPAPAGAFYWPTAYVEDGGEDAVNRLEGRYLARTNATAALMPSASASLDFPSIAAGGQESLTVTVSGANTAGTPCVALGWSTNLPAGVAVAQARVSAANTVTVTLANFTTNAIDPAAVTCRAAVIQY